MKKATVRMALLGSRGKMGRAVCDLVEKSQDVELIRCLDREDLSSKKLSQLKVDFDVLIDFSSPLATLKIASWCAQKKVALVSGTTGLTASQMSQLRRNANKCPIVWSANFSVGIAALRSALRSIGALDWDFQVEEIHHKHKKDAPSGTAKLLQEDLKRSSSRSLPSVLSMRAGSVRGIHKVWAFGEEEILTLSHEALSRNIFAAGAIRSAIWLCGRRPRWYEFAEVLGL